MPYSQTAAPKSLLPPQTEPELSAAQKLAMQADKLCHEIETLCSRNAVFFWKGMGAPTLLRNIASRLSQEMPLFTSTEVTSNKNKLLTMLRRANEDIDSNRYNKLITDTYTMVVKLTKHSPLNSRSNDNKILDPISGEIVDLNNSIELSSGFSYNLDSVRHLAQKSTIDDRLINHKHEKTNCLLLKQDTQHIQTQLSAFAHKHLEQQVACVTPVAWPTKDPDITTAVIAERSITVAMAEPAIAITTEDQETLENLNLSYCNFAQNEGNPIYNIKPAKSINLSNADLTNQDISTLQCEKIIFNKKTQLNGTKLSKELTEKASENSRKIIRKTLANTYYKNSSFFSLSSWKLWTKEWSDYLNGKYDDLSSTLSRLQEQANNKNDKVAEITLNTHGLFTIPVAKAMISQETSPHPQ